MTKVQNPIIGRARASAGGMTFTKNYDKNVMRSKPFEVKNPKTAAQVKQRDFFKQVQGIVATVSDEQLRSLFGDMPKAMSRRNALSKQVAAAYSMNGNSKVVDFSKLGAIGNGEKVTTPIVQFTNGTSTDLTTITAAMLNVNDNQNPNFILVAFDTVNNGIFVVNTQDALEDSETTADVVTQFDANFTGYAYVTCATSGEDVYLRGFGSFIIKTRAVKSGRNIQKGTPMSGNNARFSAAAAGSTVTLNFNNFNFNDLMPGELKATVGDSQLGIVGEGAWEDNGNGYYTSTSEADVTGATIGMLSIEQEGEVVEEVPFNIIID